MNIIILAAGKGTRMKSALPKVLHKVASKPMLQHVVDTAMGISNSKIIIVIGHGAETVKAHFSGDVRYSNITWVNQDEQKGTGHAVQLGMVGVTDNESVMVLYGDVPLISLGLLEKAQAVVNQDKTALITATMEKPDALGRIIRNDKNEVIAIREFKDASDDERLIQEINSGIMAIPGAKINTWLNQLDNNNAQGEYYLTDLIAMSVTDNIAVEAVEVINTAEVSGVNSLLDLETVERIYQEHQAETLLKDGCYIVDKKRFDIRGTLVHGKDCKIDINCIIEGDCTLGDNVTLASNCHITNSVILSNTAILSNSIIEDSTIGNNCTVGPFARIRPNSVLADDSKVGNFVELKKTHLGKGSKVNHLSYVGDATIGENVNIGAGVITCNYDGVNKFQTVIGDNAFIGSDCQLVAPVTIGDNATIAAGTTLYKDAPKDKLTINQKSVTQIDGWTRPVKKK